MLYESARKSLKESLVGNSILAFKVLREEREKSVDTNNVQYETYSFARSKLYELHHSSKYFYLHQDGMVLKRIKNYHKNALNAAEGGRRI